MSTIEEIKSIEDPDTMFDLIIFYAYYQGQQQNNFPTDESREVFEKIKKLLKKDERK
jgi:hypothetical protein